jgi:Tol biopolymer transport system component
VSGARTGRIGLALAALAIALLAGCSGSSDSANPGIDLGSGPLLAFVGGDGNLYLSQANGDEAHSLSATPCPASVECFGIPTWSPDGQTVAVFGQSNVGNVIFLYNRLGVEIRAIQTSDPDAFGPAIWSSDSKTIFFKGRPMAGPPSSGSTTTQIPPLQIMAFSAETGKEIGTTPVPPVTNAACSDETRGGALGSTIDQVVNGYLGQRLTFGVSPDNNTFLVSSGNCYLQTYLVDRASGKATLLAPTQSGAYVLQAQFSPDGKKILVVQTSAGEDDLIVYNADGSNPQQISSDTDPLPAFAPRISAPSWSSDGRSIYFTHGADLWEIGSDGSNPHMLAAGATSGSTLKAEVDPTPQPGGQSLAWVEVSLAAGEQMPTTGLFVANADGSGAQEIIQNAIWPAWS